MSISKTELVEVLGDLREELSDFEHKRWSHWQRYMHQESEKQPDGSLLVPAELVARWERQMSTEYQELSEDEKESDREQVDQYLPIIEEALRRSTFMN